MTTHSVTTPDGLDERMREMRVGEVRSIWISRATSQGDNRGCLFAVVRTEQDGINTGRPRFMVGCTTCDAFMHEATTSIESRMRQHLHKVGA